MRAVHINPTKAQTMREVYIANAIPAMHGGSVVFEMEVGDRVFAFELDGDGNPCAGSEYIADSTGYMQSDNPRLLSAARELLLKHPLEQMKRTCSLRAKRLDMKSFGWFCGTCQEEMMKCKCRKPRPESMT